MSLKLTYFTLPGKAEVARLILTLGNKSFEDHRISPEEWRGGLKAQVPFGQVPVLYIDGKPLAQSAAINRYAAKIAGLLPEDPFSAAVADQAYFFAEDLWQPVGATKRLPEEEGVKARQELVNGVLADRLKQLSKLVESRPGKYLAGDKLTHGDLNVFVKLSLLQSGWLEGIPTNILDDYPAVKELWRSIATIPEIAAFYSKEDDDVRNKGFKA